MPPKFGKLRAPAMLNLNPLKSPRGRVAYLTLQVTAEGQAAHAHVNEIIRGLRAAGWAVDLYAPRYSAQAPSVASRLAEFARLQSVLGANLSRYDAIYVRSHTFAYPLARLAHVRRVPVIQECNGPYEDMFIAWPVARPARKILVAAQRRQYAMASVNVAVTAGLCDMIDQETGRSDSALIPNGADTSLFRPDLERDPDLPETYVVFFGALAAWQGVTTMMRAKQSPFWPKLVELVVVGDGAMRPEVERAARSDPGIRYLGKRPYSQIPAIVSNSLASLCVKDDAVHSGTGLSPLKMYESMSCGVPTIVSDVLGLRDVIADSAAGIVVPPNDPHAVAKAVAYLHTHPHSAREMGVAARSVAVQRLSWRRRGEDTAALLELVLGRGHARCGAPAKC